MERFTLRIALDTDIDDLFRIRTSVRDNHLSVEQMAELGITHDTLPAMLTGAGRGWVAEQQGQVVAFSMADAEDATIFAVFVDPAFEGHGLGKRLTQAAEEWLFAQGCTEIWLNTDNNRDVRANGFYRHLGWIEEGPAEDEQTRFIKRLLQ